MKPLFRRLREGVKTLQARALGFHRNEEGAGTVAIVFFMIAGAALLAFAVDATRVTSDASRLKQATDAAAAAVTLEHAKNADADVNEMAERYVASNLGLDIAQLNRELTVTVEPVTWKDYSGTGSARRPRETRARSARRAGRLRCRPPRSRSTTRWK